MINDKIGICGDDYYYFTKLLSMSNIEIVNLIITIQTNELIQKFVNLKIKDNQ